MEQQKYWFSEHTLPLVSHTDSPTPKIMSLAESEVDMPGHL